MDGPDEQDLSDTFLKRLKGTLTCLVCGPLHRFPSGKTHKSRTKHDMREMTPQERAQEIAWYREIQAEGETARLKVLDQKRASEKAAAAAAHMDVPSIGEAAGSAGIGESAGSAGIGDAAGSAAVVPASARSEYVFDFGKHKGKTLSTVWRTLPTYLPYLINQKGFLDTVLTLKRAMEAAGIMDEALRQAGVMRRESSHRVVAQAAAEETAGVQLHPEVAKLRTMQLEDAREVLAGLPVDQPPEPAQESRLPRGRKPRKQGGSRGGSTLQHCWVCGSIDHKTVTCPDQPEEVRIKAQERQLRAANLLANRRRAVIVTHLKYVSLHQRTPSYEQRPSHSASVRPARTGKELLRMSAYDFVKAQIEDKVLMDLQGAPCTQPGCFSGSAVHVHGDRARVLGRLSRSRTCTDLDVSLKTVCYRCLCCRTPVAVTHGSVMFSKVGGGAASLTDNVLAFFNCVHDVSVTATCKQLGLSEPVVRGFYDTARTIMERGALRRQKLIVFGGLADNKTADIEPDEAQFFKWSEDAGTEDGEKDYHYYVWLGVRQRGSPDKFYLEELGVKTSHGAGRIPPLSPSKWHEVCSRIFRADSNLVQMSDSAMAYTCRPLGLGVVEGYSVNHSRKPTPELARSVDALADVVTLGRRAAICSTNLIDPTWGVLKDMIPDGGIAGRTVVGQQRLASYIRMGQWKVMNSTYDRWGPFCQDAELYEKDMLATKAKILMQSNALTLSAKAKLQKQARGQQMLFKKVCPLQDDGVAGVVAETPVLRNVKDTLGSTEGAIETAAKRQRTADPRPAAADEELKVQSEAAWGSRYFESQAAGGKCGQHALNNMLGNPVFAEVFLEDACQQVLATLGPREHPLQHRQGHGWYSHSVLSQVLENTVPPMWRLALGPTGPEQWESVVADTSIGGVLCNIRNAHWTCIAKHSGNIFYVDSQHHPVLIARDAFVDILRTHPMCFLVVLHDSQY
jgi:predicted nucleic acid-binding Zn ribbon protein